MTSLNNYYNINLKKYARENRKKQTKGESILWSRLRKKQLLNYKFLRQRPVSNFIVDFLQPDTKLVIEVDGSSHTPEKYNYDIWREQCLKALGFRVIRFTEYYVVKNLDDVLKSIEQSLIEIRPKIKIVG